MTRLGRSRKKYYLLFSIEKVRWYNNCYVQQTFISVSAVNSCTSLRGFHKKEAARVQPTLSVKQGTKKVLETRNNLSQCSGFVARAEALLKQYCLSKSDSKRMRRDREIKREKKIFFFYFF